MLQITHRANGTIVRTATDARTTANLDHLNRAIARRTLSQLTSDALQLSRVYDGALVIVMTSDGREATRVQYAPPLQQRA